MRPRTESVRALPREWDAIWLCDVYIAGEMGANE